jgi:hypothetical protein
MKGRLREPMSNRCCPTGMVSDCPVRPADILLDDYSKTITKRAEIYGSRETDQHIVSPYPPSHHIRVDKVRNLT